MARRRRASPKGSKQGENGMGITHERGWKVETVWIAWGPGLKETSKQKKDAAQAKAKQKLSPSFESFTKP